MNDSLHSTMWDHGPRHCSTSSTWLDSEAKTQDRWGTYVWCSRAVHPLCHADTRVDAQHHTQHVDLGHKNKVSEGCAVPFVYRDDQEGDGTARLSDASRYGTAPLLRPRRHTIAHQRPYCGCTYSSDTHNIAGGVCVSTNSIKCEITLSVCAHPVLLFHSP